MATRKNTDEDQPAVAEPVEKTSGKVAETTRLKDPTGAIVTLRKGDPCPEWAITRVATV